MSTAAERVRAWVFYSGRVQGVGFRYLVNSTARSFAVTGFVRNLTDGRVELVAEGERAEIDRFLQAVADAMAGNIRSANVTILKASGEFPIFSVQY